MGQVFDCDNLFLSDRIIARVEFSSLTADFALFIFICHGTVGCRHHFMLWPYNLALINFKGLQVIISVHLYYSGDTP